MSIFRAYASGLAVRQRSPFSEADRPRIAETVQGLVPAVVCIVKDGVDLAMNRFNPVKKKKALPLPDAAAEETNGAIS